MKKLKFYYRFGYETWNPDEEIGAEEALILLQGGEVIKIKLIEEDEDENLQNSHA